MRYCVDFCIASMIYLGITMFAYLRQRKVPGPRSGLYAALLWLGMASLALDVLAAVCDARALPDALEYAVNILFLLCTQGAGLVFCLYTLVLMGVWPGLGRPARAGVLAPFIASAALILLSPLGRFGAFYIEDGLYCYGATHLLLYVVSGLYLIASAAVVIARRDRIRRRKRLTICGFIGLTLTAMLLQLRFPMLLLNSTATALALTMMYYALEAPSMHIDALTGAFNVSALDRRIGDLTEQNQRFSLLMFRLDSLNMVNETLGEHRGDEVLIAFAALLGELFPGQEIARPIGNGFAVLDLGATYDHERLQKTYDRVRGGWRLKSDVSLLFWCACVNSEACPSKLSVLNAYHELLDEHGAGGEEALLADEEYRREQSYRAEVAAAVTRAMDEDRLMVYYQPMHDERGRLAALEALVRVNDEKLGFISPELFVPIAERNGSIHRLGRIVLEKACAFIEENRLADWGLEHVGVNLSVAQCMGDELPDFVADTAARHHVPPALLGLEITETEAAASMQTVRANMLALRARGFRFLLDDFGSGHANFHYISQLAFSCVKIDKLLLWGVEKNAGQLAFLTSVCTMLHQMGMRVVCEGVETESQVALLRRLGVELLQGYYYSKPLSPEALLRYAKAHGVGGGADDGV